MSRPALPAFRPPTREGLNPSLVALPAGPWPTVLAFLCQRFPKFDEAHWQGQMARGGVLDEAGHPLPPDTPYPSKPGPASRLWYWREPPAETPIPFEASVVYRDEALLVADKPHFLPTVPSGRYARHTLLARLQHQLGLDTLVPMHRLDRETAGLVAFCIQPRHRNAYQGLFRDRQVHKVYEAIAPYREGLPWPQERFSRMETSAAHFMQMAEVPGEPNAHTRIELVEKHPEQPLARYRLSPSTGQTHQLRVHMLGLGLPILGDQIYPVLQPEPAPGELPDFSAPLQLLARELAFTDPVTGQARHFVSAQRLKFPDWSSSTALAL